MQKSNQLFKGLGLFARLASYFKPYRKIMFFDLSCAALTTACDLVLPLIVRHITGIVTTNAAALTLALVLKMGTPSNDLKLFTAITVTVALSLPRFKGYLATLKRSVKGEAK
jgi:ATP-binding cassette subfamily B protein